MKVIIVTGTPGTGKTTLATGLAKHYGYDLINIAELEGEFITGSIKGVKVIDVDRLVKYIEERRANSNKHLIVDGHLSHYYPPDNTKICFVLRCDPFELKNRLIKRGYSKDKIKVNLEAEAMDLILQEAMQAGHNIHEIDTTQMTDEQLINEAISVIDGLKKPVNGVCNFTYYLT